MFLQGSARTLAYSKCSMKSHDPHQHRVSLSYMSGKQCPPPGQGCSEDASCLKLITSTGQGSIRLKETSILFLYVPGRLGTLALRHLPISLVSMPLRGLFL